MPARWLLPLALTLLGCKSELDCSLPPPTEFSEAWDLTEGDIEAVLAAVDTTRAELTCDEACTYAHAEWTGDSPDQIDACVLELDSTAGATSDTVVGTVTCDGISTRFYCI
ncbi:MAG: hypothetical protein KC912_09125 [Proteobacteria bacterium]|nr:hypothetical protein [Pseudomonadota bacterium]